MKLTHHALFTNVDVRLVTLEELISEDSRFGVEETESNQKNMSHLSILLNGIPSWASSLENNARTPPFWQAFIYQVCGGLTNTITLVTRIPLTDSFVREKLKAFFVHRGEPTGAGGELNDFLNF